MVVVGGANFTWMILEGFYSSETEEVDLGDEQLTALFSQRED